MSNLADQQALTLQILGHVDDDWVPLDEHPGAQEDVPGVLVVRIRDSLNFGTAETPVPGMNWSSR